MSGSEIFFICEMKSTFVSVLRSRSAIDDIGTIEYITSRTVIILQIEDINDNRPEFDVTSITVGYPSTETVHQLLPPYLMKVQVMRTHAGLPSGKQVNELGLFYSSKCFFLMTFQSKQVKCYINGQIGALEKQPRSILNVVFLAYDMECSFLLHV